MDVDRLCALIQPERIRELTFALTCIPSPTGQATACTVAASSTCRPRAAS